MPFADKFFFFKDLTEFFYKIQSFGKALLIIEVAKLLFEPPDQGLNNHAIKGDIDFEDTFDLGRKISEQLLAFFFKVEIFGGIFVLKIFDELEVVFLAHCLGLNYNIRFGKCL